MKKKLSFLVLLLIIGCIYIGVVLFKDRNYKLISMIIALLACLPFFFTFEKKKDSTRKMVLISTMIALSVVGRLVFVALPGFKPVTAMVVITSLSFGPEAGFLTGALTAVISNFFYGQGPWTPFQMFVWGFLGYAAGLMAQKLKKNKVLLMIYGALAGVAFSLMMDIWTVLAADGTFNLMRYKVAVLASFRFMITYAFSNMIFLWFMEKPVGRRLERLKTKYGL